jgi:preprotein translocase subunit SecA
MDYLREGIGLRAMAQRDPLVEYQREGYDMFNEMMEGIKEESATALFNLQIEVQQNPIVEEVAEGVVPGMLFGAKAAPQQGQQQQPQRQSAAAPATGAKPRRPRPTPPPVAAEPAAPVPAAFGGVSTGTKPGNARAAQQPGQPSPAQPEPDPASGSGRNPKRGKHAADGRGHATAAGRGQAATESSGQQQQGGPALPPGFEPHRPRQLQYSAPSDSGGVEVKRDSNADPYASVGRNDPCPCGSGRKYKRCHGDRSTQ